MRLGIHGSIRQGYSAAIESARSLGCASLQIFSYRRHHEPAQEELASAAAAAEGLELVVHTRYLPLLAAADPQKHLRCVQLLARELKLAEALGGRGLIVHAGAYPPGKDLAFGLRRFAEGAKAAYDRCGAKLPLILENVPGGGRRMGGPLEELAALGELLEKAGIEIGYCIDTAHAWAQGYDISSAEGMLKFLAQLHRRLGADKIRAFHLNDTRALLGSHQEHHWHFGKGFILPEAMRALLERSEYADRPGIIETPAGFDAENLALLRSLIG